MMMRRREFVGKCGIATATGIGLSGCSSIGGSSESSGSNAPLNVGLAVPNWSPSAPVELAQEKGYYEEFDTEINLTIYGGGGEASNALAGGEEDIVNFNGAGLAQAVERGASLKAVAGDQILPFGWSLVANKESDVGGIADLDDKKIGVASLGGTTHFHALGAASDGGVEVELVPLGASGLISSLQNKEVAASSTFPPLNFTMEEDMGFGTSIYQFESLGPTLCSLWTANETAIEKKRDQIQGALNAMFKGRLYMQENRDESLEYLNTYTENSQRVVRRSFDDVIRRMTTTGEFGTEELNNVIELASLAEGNDNLPAAEDLLTDEFIPIDVST